MMLLVIFTALAVYLYMPTPYSQNAERMAGDVSAVFSMQKTSQSQDILQHIDIQTIDIQYINKDGQVSSRPIWLHLPKNTQTPVPLVFVPHYEMKSESSDLQSYIKQGWAVASPKDFVTQYNGVLTTDDLVFNHASLYALRNNPLIDKQKIVLVGGSAGGYMTLMLASQQMGITASHASAPITNFLF